MEIVKLEKIFAKEIIEEIKEEIELSDKELEFIENKIKKALEKQKSNICENIMCLTGSKSDFIDGSVIFIDQQDAKRVAEGAIDYMNYWIFQDKETFDFNLANDSSDNQGFEVFDSAKTIEDAKNKIIVRSKNN